jgi:hypothetical protein
MEMKDIIKLGLLGVAGWWVYNDFLGPQLAAVSGGGVTAPPPVPDMPGASAGAPPPAGSGQQVQAPPPPPGQAPPPPTQDQLKKAATDATYAQSFRPDFLLNQHQWNYYRSQAGQAPIMHDLSTDPHHYTMNAAEFHSRIAQVGVAGLRGMRGVGGRFTVH